MVLFFLSSFLLAEGGMQGIITWLFREYVPPTRQDWIDAALHWGGVIIYGVLTLAIAYYRPTAGAWYWVLADTVVLAVLARGLLFDVALNLGRIWFDHREHRPKSSLWAVGTSARSDKSVQALAAWLKTRWPGERVPSPEGVRFACWLLALVLVVLYAHFLSPFVSAHG